MLPILLSEGVNKGRITIEKVAELSNKNAKIHGMHPQKGEILPGSDADLVIIDLKKKVKVSPEILHHASDFTLFDGWEITGWPQITIKGGKIAMENGQLLSKVGDGRYLPCKKHRNTE